MSTKREADAIKQQVRDLLKTDLPEFYKIAKDLIQDPKVPSSARAKMLSDLFRAAGMFTDDEGAGAKEPHEMSAADLQEAIAIGEAELRKRTQTIFG
jgi:hypothetical protein